MFAIISSVHQHLDGAQAESWCKQLRFKIAHTCASLKGQNTTGIMLPDNSQHALAVNVFPRWHDLLLHLNHKTRAWKNLFPREYDSNGWYGWRTIRPLLIRAILPGAQSLHRLGSWTLSSVQWVQKSISHNRSGVVLVHEIGDAPQPS